MTAEPNNIVQLPSVEEVQQGWNELASRVGQLEAERSVLEQENKTLRFLLERVIEHRQKSHSELVLLLTGLVSKLPISDVGVVVSRLVEHNTNVSEICAALTKGTVDIVLPQPAVLKALEQTKRELLAAVKPVVEELVKLDPPLEIDMLQSLVTQPEQFFSPRMVRANRCFIKGHVPRERIAREFGEPALVFFNDMTTDPKLNPRPKPDEIMLGFKSDFESLFQQNGAVVQGKGEELMALYQKVQHSKSGEQGRSQRNAFTRLSFILELLHYYENQNLEAPDVVFAQRLPALVEQLVVSGPQDQLDEKLIVQAEELVAHIVNPDYRQAVVNNVGKGGGIARTLKYVLKLRADKVIGLDETVGEFVKQLLVKDRAPSPESLTAVLRLIKPDMQRTVVRAIMDSDRLRKEDSESVAKAAAKELGLTGLDAPKAAGVSEETEREQAWDRIRQLIIDRAPPTEIADAFRNRLRSRYEPEEVKLSWITLIEADPMSLIRVFCQLPYQADGSTDPVARAAMETYISRLMHEKYAAARSKVVNSLRNMFKANPGSPTLVNFMALAKWIDKDAAARLSAEIGMPATQ